MINITGRNNLCAVRTRRGNSLVLVSGILALLVIIATAYVTRTQSGRITSVAEQSAAQRDNNAELIAEMLAQIPAEHLFAWPVDPTYNPTFVADSNDPRIKPETYKPSGTTGWMPSRYGVDPVDEWDVNGNQIPDGLPDRPYNFAPYQVVPYTNPPDVLVTDSTRAPLWPAGPGNLHALAGTGSDYMLAEGNPLGNPGFGDCRWLRDIEPMRWDWDADGLGNGNSSVDRVYDRFMGWRHLSYIGTPWNAWRICTDISDVFDLSGDANSFGAALTDLSIPVEQWMGVRPENVYNNPGTYFDTTFTSAAAFGANWTFRFNLTFNESLLAQSFYAPAFIPANFYRLRDIDGDGVFPEAGSRPSDEFVGPNANWPDGTPRWNVSRILADSDGDGYTDSFWWIAPTPVVNGVRQVVAVSIIDNSAMLNVNAATRFHYNNDLATDAETRGETPADLALVSALNTSDAAEGNNTRNCGFYDNPSHHFLPYQLAAPYQYDGEGSEFDYYFDQWGRHREEIGFEIMDPDPDGPNRYYRRDFWLRSASRPLNVDTTSAYNPFSLADELELRMYYGQNYPYIFSRYEHSVQDTNALQDENFLRAIKEREETSEYLYQRPNFALLIDNRHKLTCFNSSRNDLMPPWLRWRWSWPEGIDTPVEIANFEAQSMKKVDLREPKPADFSLASGEWYLSKRLPYALMLGLTDAWEHPLTGVLSGDSYYGEIETGNPSGDPDANIHKVRRAAAGWAANILAWRDADMDAPLWEDDGVTHATTPIPELGDYLEGEVAVDGSVSPDHRFLGMEAQPFLLEAYIAHVYASEEFGPDPPIHKPLYGYSEDANYVDDSHEKSTVIVVQIANPFNRAIDLTNYKIRVGDGEVTLSGTLLPCREERPVTGIFYAIEEEFEHDDPKVGTVNFRADWLDFLDLTSADHPAETIIDNVLNDDDPFGTPTWSTDPEDYYSITLEPHHNFIELIRTDHSNADGVIREVVVDRFDYQQGDTDHDEFVDAVEDMIQPPADSGAIDWNTDSDPEPYSYKAGIRLGTDNEWFVTSVRVTRGWGWDVDLDGYVEADEKAPRFVIASQSVVEPDSSPHGDTESEYQFDGDVYDNAGEENRYIGNAFAQATSADDWYNKTFTRYSNGATTVDVTRKPTFFNMAWELDPEKVNNAWSYPDKGFYRFKGQWLLARPLQMLHKDGDFETIGELRHVFLFGHELIFGTSMGSGYDYEYTDKTFAEFMHDPEDDASGPPVGSINRITNGPVIGFIDPNDADYSINHPSHSVPNLPAGLRVFDAFVCDSYGYNGLAGHGEEFYNAEGFSGRGTPALVNINTAMPEVMHSLPHCYKLLHEDSDELARNNPRVGLAEALVQYRDRNPSSWDLGGGYTYAVNPIEGAPDYRDRGLTNLRGDRGLASIGEVLLLDEEATDAVSTGTGINNPSNHEYLGTDCWRVDFASKDPFDYEGQMVPLESAQISTDLQDVFNYSTGDVDVWDGVAGDREESNLLFSGASNLITTRSDMFTIYFKIRSFRQNPTTKAWDATDPEYIVDESRYVMLVDRSEVNYPSDKPKILYLEKLPN